RVERDPTLVVPLGPRDLRTAQTATALDLDPLRPGTHRGLDRPLHRTPERDALHQLMRHVVGDELSVQFGTLDLLDVDRDFALHEEGQLITELVHLGALLPDHDSGS